MVTKIVTLRLTEEQIKVLDAKARAAGFMQRSNYIRFVLFMTMTVEDKISEIYDKLCYDGWRL